MQLFDVLQGLATDDYRLYYGGKLWSAPTVRDIFARTEIAEPKDSSLNTVKDILQTEIQMLEIDSRQVLPNCLFIALKGRQTDGHRYLAQALANGAVAAVVETVNFDLNFPQILVKSSSRELGNLCNLIYQTDALKMQLLAVTGTDGKSTIASLCQFLINELVGPAGFIGTIGVNYPNYHSDHATYSTPPAPQLHQIIQTMAKHNLEAVCMEASSQALDQNRLAGLTINTAILSHLAVDHLDYHQNFENYLEAKAKLFETLAPTNLAILNANDLAGLHLALKTKAKAIFYQVLVGGESLQAQIVEAQRQNKPSAVDAVFSSLSTSADDHYLGQEYMDFQKHLRASLDVQRLAKLLAISPFFVAKNIKHHAHKLEFEVEYQGRSYPTVLNLHGDYNVANALAAVAAVWQTYPQLELTDILAKLADFQGVVGRYEEITLNTPYRVIIDFAHTPGAIKALLNGIRRQPRTGKLIVLCNSCGDRDHEKRPLIAKICEDYADEIILCLEEVGKEKPETILAMLQAGLTKKPYYLIPLRQAAIRFAIQRLAPGDVLVLPSLGDMTTYNIGDIKFPYSERQMVEQALTERMMVEQIISQSEVYQTPAALYEVQEIDC